MCTRTGIDRVHLDGDSEPGTLSARITGFDRVPGEGENERRQERKRGETCVCVCVVCVSVIDTIAHKIVTLPITLLLVP